MGEAQRPIHERLLTNLETLYYFWSLKIFPKKPNLIMKRKTLFFILILCITPGKCWHIDKCWQSFDRKTAHRRTESLAYFSYIHWIKHNCLIINANWNGHLELPLTTSPLISSHYVYTQQMENMYYRFCHRQANQTTPVVKSNAQTFLMLSTASLTLSPK